MTLKSRLFAGIRPLEDAADDNAAHVLPGAAGDHVGRIQQALFLLDGALIAPHELRTRHYGPGTARAVLDYKRKRNIVNHAYQQAADDIVGVMTMAALDTELLRRDWRGTRSRGCGDCAGGGSMPVAHGARLPRLNLERAAAAGAEPQSRRFPAVLSVVVMWTTAALRHPDSAQSRRWRYFERAAELMSLYGQRFEMIPSAAEVPATALVSPLMPSDFINLRKVSEKVMPGMPNVLRIIVCPFEKADEPYYGLTAGGKREGSEFREFIVLKSNATREDQCTVLHEMMHAAARADDKETVIDRWKHDGDTTSLYSEGSNRSQYLPIQAQAISEAYFARGL